MADPLADDVLRVAVGVLRRSDGRVLVAERARWRHQGDCLEFPGGKCGPAEAAGDALRRELHEEIGVAVTATEPLIRVRHDYGDRRVELETRLVTAWCNEPHGAEGQAIHWVDPASLDTARFPAANRPIVAALTRPPLCLVTPDTDVVADDDELLAGLDAALTTGRYGLVHVRRRDRGSPAWYALVTAIARSCGARGVDVVAHGGADVLAGLPERVGLHLPAGELRTIAARPVSTGRLFSCACHDDDELGLADALGADHALVGPVRPTRTHPGAHALGWTGLATLAARTTVPLYALGGLRPDDLAPARHAGAIGVAGIRGFWRWTATG